MRPWIDAWSRCAALDDTTKSEHDCVDWILVVSLDDHEEMVGLIEQVMVDSGAAVSLCSLGYALEVPMFNHPRRATLRTAFGAQHARQKMVEYESGDGGSVNGNIEVADVTRPLVWRSASCRNVE